MRHWSGGAQLLLDARLCQQKGQQQRSVPLRHQRAAAGAALAIGGQVGSCLSQGLLGRIALFM